MIPFPVRPLLEVADILRAHGEAYAARHPVSARQAAVMRRLVACRTAALGGHVDACGRCGYTRVSYNSCRDRHCPKCQGVKRAAWLEARLERLLPVEHYAHQSAMLSWLRRSSSALRFCSRDGT
jgi:Transposase zinc-binding domain